MVTENHYRWDFIGLSTDEKPTPATSEKVVDGSTYYTSDDSKLYVFCKDQWYEKIPIGGGGGGGDEPAGDGVITAYNSEKGEITGSGFGSTAGKVYMLDRDTHSYVEQEVKSWSSTKIALKTPLDLDHLEGNTSIVAVLDNGTWSTKLVVYGKIEVEGTGKLYYRKDDGTVGTVTASIDDLNNKSSNGWKLNNVGGVTIYSTDVLGFQFGKAATAPVNGFNSAFGWCVNLNQPIVIPDDFTYIQSMLVNCYSFNQPLILPKNLTTLGNTTSILENCYNFNQPIVIPSGVTEIKNDFLKNGSSFNQKITLPSGLTKIGNNFLNSCRLFNQPLELPSTLTNIGTYFLYSTASFNQPLTIPDTVTTLSDYFLNACGTKQQVTLPSNLTTIGNYVMGSMTSYNFPITLPSSVTTIGDYFLYNMRNFTSAVTLPEGLTSIGSYFLANNYGYYLPITVPSTVTSVGSYFLNAVYSVSEVTVNTNYCPSDTYSLAVSSNNAKAYVNGITIKGTGASVWLTALPNRTSSPYRKLIDGTAE